MDEKIVLCGANSYQQKYYFLKITDSFFSIPHFFSERV